MLYQILLDPTKYTTTEVFGRIVRPHFFQCVGIVNLQPHVNWRRHSDQIRPTRRSTIIHSEAIVPHNSENNTEVAENPIAIDNDTITANNVPDNDTISSRYPKREHVKPPESLEYR